MYYKTIGIASLAQCSITITISNEIRHGEVRTVVQDVPQKQTKKLNPNTALILQTYANYIN